eukprot:5418290-Pyramimonas_sp.AAC.1
MADVVPLPGVRASQGYPIAPECRVCQAPLGSYGHIWHGCAGLVLDGVDALGETVPDKILSHREALINS